MFSLLECEIKLHTFYFWDNRGPKNVIKWLTDGRTDGESNTKLFQGSSKTIEHRGNSVFKGNRLFADMRLNHASPRALPVMHNCSFLFSFFLGGGGGGNRVTLYMHLHFEWFLDSALIVQILHIQFSPVLVMLWSVVIISLNWCSVSTKKSFCIYQSTTWPGRNIGHIMNHNISIQTKLCMQELFVEL